MHITFLVNTTIPLTIRGDLPYTQSTFTSDDIANQVVAYLPNQLLNNRYITKTSAPTSAGNLPNGNGYFSNGVTFTAANFEAQYLRDNYTTGLYPVLTVVSTTI